MNSVTLAIAAAAMSVTAPGPQGDLAGTFLDSGSGAPLVLILPGSGPTDRDGNNPLGVKAAPYRLLAEDLAQRGISTVRIDKRGLFESRQAVADPNAVTLSDYAEDVRSWIETMRRKTGARCLWLAGHSEGGLVALTAAQEPDGVCGIILIATPGRKLGILLREQLRANPANAPLLDPAMKVIAELEAGNRVDVSGLHPALKQLFASPVQGFLVDLMAADPTRLAADVTLPMLILHGGEDLQVRQADAAALHSAQPRSRLLVVPGMNHVLKAVPEGDRQANLATYADPARPIDPTLAEAIAEFIAGR